MRLIKCQAMRKTRRGGPWVRGIEGRVERDGRVIVAKGIIIKR